MDSENPTPPNEPIWLDDICMVLSDEFQTPVDGIAHEDKAIIAAVARCAWLDEFNRLWNHHASCMEQLEEAKDNTEAWHLWGEQQ